MPWHAKLKKLTVLRMPWYEGMDATACDKRANKSPVREENVAGYTSPCRDIWAKNWDKAAALRRAC